MQRISGAISAAALVLICMGCGLNFTPTAAGGRPNVIIVMVDTLRADHMSTYGYARPTTPFIDSLAEDALVFERARAQAACTFPSVNSVFTSRYPFDFYRQPEGQMGIPEDLPTIATMLQSAGYSTAAISASPIVRKTPNKHNPNGGFQAGFEVFNEACLWMPASCVNQQVKKVVSGLQEPFFLYLHYMEPHSYYSPPPTYQRVFARNYAGYDFIAEGDPNPIEEMLFSNGPKLEISDADIQHLVDLYDDEIRYFDNQLQRLVTELKASGLFDKSLFILTADHGEEFMEHGQVGHCRGVWDTLTRVPLIIRLPAGTHGGRIREAVQLVDLVPTILDILDVSAQGARLEGFSLAPILGHRQTPQRFAYSDQGRYRAVDDGRWHLIIDGVSSLSTLYNVLDDPLEQQDLFRAGHPELNRLGSALNLWLLETGQSISFDETLAAAKRKEDELRALGYLQ